ncbi:MAG TPA: phenylalanine--tRNA ligase subunit alpha [Candidatus Onthoplasma faecigallinarum]|nr:phenylalanine--tRNA ligase subunit alpha [Candidatus Onthoplasma faecigallinarum]
MKEKIEEIISYVKEKIETIEKSSDCQNLRIETLGKNGKITELFRFMKEVPVSEKQALGQLLNNAKQQVESIISAKETFLQSKELEEKLMGEKIDVTLDLNPDETGALHPVTIDFMRMAEILTGMGFSQIDGPEIEYDKYNFELVNIPADSPSRDMQDSLYITNSILLRTQTSNTQPRAMEKIKPPFKVFSFGRVFRKDDIDATHTPAFHQLEGIYIDKKVSLADLKHDLSLILKRYLGESTKTKFRASYFPFTEPSVEVDAECNVCKGKGCAACNGAGQYEILGAGMIHPHVLELNGIDPNEYSGYAFGFGFDRFPKMRYKIPNAKVMFENDVRFIRQFK